MFMLIIVVLSCMLPGLTLLKVVLKEFEWMYGCCVLESSQKVVKNTMKS